jgi:hypothetical protein
MRHALCYLVSLLASCILYRVSLNYAYYIEYRIFKGT